MRTKLQDIRGMIPALLTPFNEDESFAEDKVRPLVDFLIGMGIDGFYITGSTGEGIMMKSEERRRAVSCILDAIGGRLPSIVHIGQISAKEAVSLARQAEEAGADAVSSVPPFYFGFSRKEIVSYYRAIAEATSLPVVIYNIPTATGVTMDLPMLEELASIPGIEGMKYTGENHYELGRFKRHLGKDFIMYSGRDEMLLSGLLSGADGVIGSTYNVFPDIYRKAVDALYQGDGRGASEYLLCANDVLELMFPYRLMPAMRAAMRFMGVDTGIDPAPFTRLTPEDEARLKADFKAYFTENPLGRFSRLAQSVM